MESLSAYAQAVPRPDGQAGRGLDRGALAGDLDRPEDDLAQPALDGRHGDRDLRLPAAAVGAGGQAPLPDLRAPDRGPVGRADHRPGDGARRGDPLHGARAGGAGAQGRVRQAARGAARGRLRAREDRRSACACWRSRSCSTSATSTTSRSWSTAWSCATTCASGWRTRSRRRSALADGLVEIEIVGSGRGSDAGAAGRRGGVAAWRTGRRGRGAGAARARDGREGRARGRRADRPGRGARAGHAVHLLRALRLPRARALAGGARAADLLVQLAARRVRALHGPGLADGDRPRAGGARPVAVDRRGRARAVGEQHVQLLRADDRGDRRALRRRPGRPLGGAARGAARRVPVRDQRRAGAGHLSQPLRAPALLRDAASRGSSRTCSAATARPTRSGRARRSRSTCRCGACPVCGGARLRAGVPRGARRRDADRGLLRAVGAPGAGVAGGGRALRDRPARRAADPARDLRAAALPGERRHRLPVDGPGGGDAVRRGGAAHPPGHADRLLAGRRAVHPRRALDRAAPARQLQADRHARAAARPRQHGDRRRARRADDARGRPSRGPRARGGRARRADRGAGDRRGGPAGGGVADRPVPVRARARSSCRSGGGRRAATWRSSAPASTTCATSTCTSRSAC